eukprot:24795-Rhodomonas_salina.1
MHRHQATRLTIVWVRAQHLLELAHRVPEQRVERRAVRRHVASSLDDSCAHPHAPLGAPGAVHPELSIDRICHQIEAIWRDQVFCVDEQDAADRLEHRKHIGADALG